ncbi:hypothetical protein SAMN03097694_0658 [Janthinobacterium lividum]|uniref:Uncharacterized protein n=2 Tax=Janthinobacterium lividum TaxID=29581 RepID=A0AB38C2P2_9BURK|nr:hypothetical protein SAMN03097694_0658 [Janthinobacterium lividum]
MHCMNADLSDLLRLLQNLIRLGTIAEVNGAKARAAWADTHHRMAELGHAARRQHAHLVDAHRGSRR